MYVILNQPHITNICSVYIGSSTSLVKHQSKTHIMNKNTASIIPRHSNYLFMYKSYRCKNVWKENDGGTNNNPKPDLDNINGQITILNQILIT